LYSYAEAHKIKLKSDALEAWELEKWHSERQQDLLQKEAKFKFNKQQVRSCIDDDNSDDSDSDDNDSDLSIMMIMILMVVDDDD